MNRTKDTAPSDQGEQRPGATDGLRTLTHTITTLPCVMPAEWDPIAKTYFELGHRSARDTASGKVALALDALFESLKCDPIGYVAGPELQHLQVSGYKRASITLHECHAPETFALYAPALAGPQALAEAALDLAASIVSEWSCERLAIARRYMTRDQLEAYERDWIAYVERCCRPNQDDS